MKALQQKKINFNYKKVWSNIGFYRFQIVATFFFFFLLIKCSKVQYRSNKKRFF